MMELTNKPEDVLTSSSNFAAFLEEGLIYIDRTTPTYINSGGCGHFAYLLSEQLDKHEIPYKIIATYDKKDSHDRTLKRNTIDYLRNNKRNISTENIGSHHVMLLIDNSLYVDSQGIENISFYFQDEDALEITKEELILLNNNIDSWNPLFDRECIPTIKTSLEKVFNNLDNFHTGIFHLEKIGKVKLTSYTIREKQKQVSDSPFGSLTSLLSSLHD